MAQITPEPRGSLSNMVPQSFDLAAAQGSLQPGQSLVRVSAVGLNFRDVLNVLDMYPGDPGAPGSDCSGIVITPGMRAFVSLGCKAWKYLYCLN